MEPKLDLRQEYENKAGVRCRIIEKQITWENRENPKLLCKLTKGVYGWTFEGCTFKMSETSFVQHWKPIKQ